MREIGGYCVRKTCCGRRLRLGICSSIGDRRADDFSRQAAGSLDVFFSAGRSSDLIIKIELILCHADEVFQMMYDT